MRFFSKEYWGWKKAESEPIEQKQDIIRDFVSVINELAQSNSLVDVRSLTFDKAIQYYESVGPLKKAINMIAKGFAQIDMVMEDKNGEFITEHPLLDLINSPNADTTGHEFKKAIAVFYLLTGNSFVEATGGVSRPPLEIYSKGPQFFSIEANSIDGFAELYKFSGVTKQMDFLRDIIDRRFRFYGHEKMNEIWHMRDFNARRSAGNLFGTMPITSILIDLDQYQRSSNHNLALLTNGARLSGILMNDGSMSEKQYAALKEQFKSMQGDKNAGKTMFAQSGGNGKLTYKEMSQNNKDMDFKDNKADVRFEIYNNYEIPLPLVNSEHMTMDNYSEARMDLYDNAILPTTDIIQEELSRFLLPRYPGSEGLKLSYDQQSITALLERSNQDIKNKKDSGVLKIDEVRQLYGYDPVPGGDEVYIPSTLRGLSEEPEEVEPTPVANEEAVKKAYRDILMKSGKTEEYINQKINEHFPETK